MFVANACLSKSSTVPPPTAALTQRVQPIAESDLTRGFTTPRSQASEYPTPHARRSPVQDCPWYIYPAIDRPLQVGG